MRGNSASSSSTGSPETEKLKKPHLSGAYIRSLVKQLSSSSTGDANSSLSGTTFDDQKDGKPNQQPHQHKKQVRRRLHTSRPYQERLLNMAEARREIVTALKFHRASMKQASEKQQQEQEAKLKSRRNPRIYAANSPGLHYPYSWPVSPVAPPPPPLPLENYDFTLPDRTLGLNLNLQDFNYPDSAFTSSTNPSSVYSSSPSTSSSGVPGSVGADVVDSGLHPVMDAKEIAEIRSIGEQHEMEWNDTLNVVNSAWWFKFLKVPPEDRTGEDFVNGPFDEVMEFPPWLNANEGYLQPVDDFCSDNYFKDPALPCMDIEEIEGMDGDWLA